MVRFPSHCRLVAHDANSRDDDSINWNIHTILNHDNITNHQIVSMQCLFFVISYYFHLLSIKLKYLFPAKSVFFFYLPFLNSLQSFAI